MLKPNELYPLCCGECLQLYLCCEVLQILLQIQKGSVSLLKPWEWGARVLQGFVLKLRGNSGVMFLLI